ncbi:hypothetical protein QBC38DRAFT_35361 [Podospora fimiseda]|uniref:Transcription factor n=1 Tax=Podospora fimiseda TaxID=252190 RepID=A0AAN7GT38_9PEZI|nr:hypothetical protein QBC38DRAFT_35361 [Podospora fimiseda]
MPQPLCQYENSPYVSAPVPGYRIARRDPIPGLRFADRRRNGRRIPPQLPDFGLTNPTQTTGSLPGTCTPYIPSLLVSSPPDPWHRSSVSSSISGSSTGETSWVDPIIFPQYPEPYPPGLLGNPVPDTGPYLSNNFLSFTTLTGSPVLSQPSFYRETTLSARHLAVIALQERINNPALSTTDETIAQAVKLASNDLCYGETQYLRVHISTIQQMTQLRGGLLNLGMNGTLAKMVIIITSITLELPPTFSSPSEVTPFLSSSSSSSTIPSSLDEPTAALLKDITFLIDTVLSLSSTPSEWDLQKVSSMSNWVHARLTPTIPSPSPSTPLHQSIRLAALIYCRAIQSRKKLSQIITEQDVYEVLEAVWKVPLEVWEGGMLGLLVWGLVAIMPVAKGMMPRSGTYTTKTMLMAGAVQEAMRREEGEGNVIRVLERVVGLQRWLEGGGGGISGGSGSPGGSGSGSLTG